MGLLWQIDKVATNRGTSTEGYLQKLDKALEENKSKMKAKRKIEQRKLGTHVNPPKTHLGSSELKRQSSYGTAFEFRVDVVLYFNGILGDILEGGCHVDEREESFDIDDTDWEWIYANDEFKMARKKGSSSKDLGRPLTNYEKEQHMTLEKNATILEKLGLPKLLNQMREIKKGYAKKGSENTKGIDKDKEYMPSDEALESEEDSENDNVDDVSTSKGGALRELAYWPVSLANKLQNGKKQSVVTMHKNKKSSKCPAMSMNDFLIQQQEQQ
ncbi:hypothetical protein Cgig2_011333 [Carnegiea gigantea]|uniref:Uncharacterized protein n=1 Tax=Carnegiea gigantea TaxID=171969 RepID=A0A9Q1KFZ6_9CARY|nr:hypothetical protein Cgig2_011333 [Carnegiea gigantea]